MLAGAAAGAGVAAGVEAGVFAELESDEVESVELGVADDVVPRESFR